MERHVYILFDICLLVPTYIALRLRQDLLHTAVKIGCLGGVAGVISEYFYFRDYWRPPSLTGVAHVSPEDFLFGFAITVLAFMIYPLLAHKKFERSNHGGHKQLYAGFLLAATIALYVGTMRFNINSIFVSIGVFLSSSLVVLCMRRDLRRLAVVSALILTGGIIGVYMVLFDLLFPHFWDTYWLLAHTRWGVVTLGNIPLTEIGWYASWTVFASMSYPFVNGAVLTDRTPIENTEHSSPARRLTAPSKYYKSKIAEAGANSTIVPLL